MNAPQLLYTLVSETIQKLTCTDLLLNGVHLYVFANQKHVTKGGGIIHTDAASTNWEAAGGQEEGSRNNQKSRHAACMRTQVV